MIISQFFTLSNVPQTGLTPTITIYEEGNATAVVNAQNMVENGLGWYYYDFTGYNQRKRYVVEYDGSATITADIERYKFEQLEYNPQ